MIMPSKYLREDEALIGVSAILFSLIEKSCNLSKLWDLSKTDDRVGNFERFILALDLLFIFDLIEFNNNNIKKVKDDLQNMGK